MIVENSLTDIISNVANFCLIISVSPTMVIFVFVTLDQPARRDILQEEHAHYITVIMTADMVSTAPKRNVKSYTHHYPRWANVDMKYVLINYLAHSFTT